MKDTDTIRSEAGAIRWAKAELRRLEAVSKHVPSTSRLVAWMKDDLRKAKRLGKLLRGCMEMNAHLVWIYGRRLL